MPNPWDRQRLDGKLEPMLWWSRFDTIYRPMGAERTLLGTVNIHRAKNGKEKQNYLPRSWFDAHKNWNWKIRAEAWDITEQARLKTEREAEREEWSRKRWEATNKLYDKLQELMTLPVISTTTIERDGEGRPVTVEIEGLSGRLAEIARTLKTTDEMARITTGEALPVTKVAPTDPTGKKQYDPGTSIRTEILSALSSIATASAEKTNS